MESSKKSYDEFVQNELQYWLEQAKNGDNLPNVVERLLQGAYRNYLHAIPCETCGNSFVPHRKESDCPSCLWENENGMEQLLS